MTLISKNKFSVINLVCDKSILLNLGHNVEITQTFNKNRCRLFEHYCTNYLAT